MAAIALTAHCAAHLLAVSSSTSLPNSPVAISSPETNGSWPEVKTRFPVRAAGTYEATGGTTSGIEIPSAVKRSSTMLIIFLNPLVA